MQNDPVKNAIDALLLAKSALEGKLESVNNAIRSLTGNIEGEPGLAPAIVGNGIFRIKPTNEGYNEGWTLPAKFLFFLKREQRFLHFREAADLLIETESIEGDLEVISKQISGKMSSATKPLKAKGEIVKFNPTKRQQDTFWGSPKWLNDKGEVKPGHEINKEYLMSQHLGVKMDFEI
jgi:hypothetical protein